MPFIKRKVEPSLVRRFEKTSKEVFDEHSDFVNNALVNSLLQLASVTFHAEDIFGEIEIEAKSLYKRLSRVQSRLQHVEETTRNLDPKSVRIRESLCPEAVVVADAALAVL